jgi:hypothetical protein
MLIKALGYAKNVSKLYLVTPSSLTPSLSLFSNSYIEVYNYHHGRNHNYQAAFNQPKRY